MAHGDTMALILHRVYLREWCRNMQKPDMYQLVGTHNMTETAADGTIANPGNGLKILEPIHRIEDIFELNYWGKIWMNSCSTCVLLILAGRVQVLQESNATCISPIRAQSELTCVASRWPISGTFRKSATNSE